MQTKFFLPPAPDVGVLSPRPPPSFCPQIQSILTSFFSSFVDYSSAHLRILFWPCLGSPCWSSSLCRGPRAGILPVWLTGTTCYSPQVPLIKHLTFSPSWAVPHWTANPFSLTSRVSQLYSPLVGWPSYFSPGQAPVRPGSSLCSILLPYCGFPTKHLFAGFPLLVQPSIPSSLLFAHFSSCLLHSSFLVLAAVFVVEPTPPPPSFRCVESTGLALSCPTPQRMMWRAFKGPWPNIFPTVLVTKGDSPPFFSSELLPPDVCSYRLPRSLGLSVMLLCVLSRSKEACLLQPPYPSSFIGEGLAYTR